MNNKNGREICLIVGQYPDSHSDALQMALQARGVPAALLKLSYKEDIPSSLFEYNICSNNFSVRIHTDSGTIDGDMIKTVFWRFKEPMFGLPSADPDMTDYDFRYREWKKSLGGLQPALSNAYWINPYTEHWSAGNKLLQLKVAGDVGLTVPETVVSNNANACVALFDQGPVIYKTLSNPNYSKDDVIITSEVTQEHFNSNKEQIAAAPCLFQRRIEKLFELRVTVVGESITAVKIDSQKSAVGALDWRRDQCNKSLYSLFKLPAEVRKKITNLMKTLGLVYGAIDFIVTPDNEYVFLEVNPGGQWKFIDIMAGIPLTEEIAHYIATGCAGELGSP